MFPLYVSLHKYKSLLTHAAHVKRDLFLCKGTHKLDLSRIPEGQVKVPIDRSRSKSPVGGCVLQWGASMQRMPPHCNALQHTTTHRNSLKHTVTHLTPAKTSQLSKANKGGISSWFDAGFLSLMMLLALSTHGFISPTKDCKSDCKFWHCTARSAILSPAQVGMNIAHMPGSCRPRYLESAVRSGHWENTRWRRVPQKAGEL